MTMLVPSSETGRTQRKAPVKCTRDERRWTLIKALIKTKTKTGTEIIIRRRIGPKNKGKNGSKNKCGGNILNGELLFA
jgi:hypothetical protein